MNNNLLFNIFTTNLCNNSSWTEGTSSKKEAHTGSEIYLEERQYLLGGRHGKC